MGRSRGGRGEGAWGKLGATGAGAGSWVANGPQKNATRAITIAVMPHSGALPTAEFWQPPLDRTDVRTRRQYLMAYLTNPAMESSVNSPQLTMSLWFKIINPMSFVYSGTHSSTK